MSEDFLNSLKGMPLAKAEQELHLKGMKFYSVYENAPLVPSMYYKHTVLIYNINNVVIAVIGSHT
jgi:hypothetical protein